LGLFLSLIYQRPIKKKLHLCHYTILEYILHKQTKLDTPRWLQLGILALLLGRKNNHKFRRAHNGEAEEAEGGVEERNLEVMIGKISMEIEGGAEAILNMVVGADEVKEMAQAIVEGKLQRRARRL
jgi:hypothetical protein